MPSPGGQAQAHIHTEKREHRTNNHEIREDHLSRNSPVILPINRNQATINTCMEQAEANAVKSPVPNAVPKPSASGMNQTRDCVTPAHNSPRPESHACSAHAGLWVERLSQAPKHLPQPAPSLLNTSQYPIWKPIFHTFIQFVPERNTPSPCSHPGRKSSAR